jgi:hypothetical protein
VGQWPEILAVEFHQIERVLHRVRGLVPAVQRVEHGDPILAGDHRLAVQGERLGAQLGGGRSDGGIAIGPVVAATGQQPRIRRGPIRANAALSLRP